MYRCGQVHENVHSDLCVGGGVPIRLREGYLDLSYPDDRNFQNLRGNSIQLLTHPFFPVLPFRDLSMGSRFPGPPAPSIRGERSRE